MRELRIEELEQVSGGEGTVTGGTDPDTSVTDGNGTMGSGGKDGVGTMGSGGKEGGGMFGSGN